MTTATVAEEFSAVYSRHRPALERFVRGQVRDPDLAEEIVQATFTKAWAAWSEGRAPHQPRAWLHAVARNAAVDELRARRRTLPSCDEAVLDPPDSAAARDPEAALRERELAELLWDAADELGDADRELLALQVRGGLDSGTLAKLYGIQPGAMHTRLCRMRAALREGVIASLLVARGYRECPALQAALAGARSPREIARRHVSDCPRCQAFTRPGAILAGLLPFPALARACELAWRARPRPVAVVRTAALAIALLLALAARAGDTGPAVPVTLTGASSVASAHAPRDRSSSGPSHPARRVSTSPASYGVVRRSMDSRREVRRTRRARTRGTLVGMGGRPVPTSRRPTSQRPSAQLPGSQRPASRDPSSGPAAAQPAAPDGAQSPASSEPAPPQPQPTSEPQPQPTGQQPAPHDPEPQPSEPPQHPPPGEEEDSSTGSDEGRPPSGDDPGRG